MGQKKQVLRAGDNGYRHHARRVVLLSASHFEQLHDWVVLCAFARYVNDDGAMFASSATLGAASGLGRVAIGRRLRRLQAAGWLVRRRRATLTSPSTWAISATKIEQLRWRPGRADTRALGKMTDWARVGCRPAEIAILLALAAIDPETSNNRQVAEISRFLFGDRHRTAAAARSAAGRIGQMLAQLSNDGLIDYRHARGRGCRPKIDVPRGESIRTVGHRLKCIENSSAPDVDGDLAQLAQMAEEPTNDRSIHLVLQSVSAELIAIARGRGRESAQRLAHTGAPPRAIDLVSQLSVRSSIRRALVGAQAALRMSCDPQQVAAAAAEWRRRRRELADQIGALNQNMQTGLLEQIRAVDRLHFVESQPSQKMR